MHQTIKTVFRLCFAASIFLITLALVWTCIVKTLEIKNATQALSQAQQFELKSTAAKPLVLVTNNQKPDESVFILVANQGFIAKMSCEHYAQDLCTDAENQSHRRQIDVLGLKQIGQQHYIQHIQLHDSQTQKVSRFAYSDAQIQAFFQQDIQQLKYVVFGIAIFALIALYVSFRILRNFKQFLRK
ncbi:hypothetical protein [Acinetobacter sp. NigerLNRRAM0016]